MTRTQSKRESERFAMFRDPSFLKSFIEAYRNLPCLWNRNDASYQRREAREAAYSNLVNLTRKIIPEADEEFVKMKLGTLRKTFWKEYRKREKSPSSRKFLWYFDLLQFIVDEPYRMERNASRMDDEKARRRSPRCHTSGQYLGFIQDESNAEGSTSSADDAELQKLKEEGTNIVKINRKRNKDEYDTFGEIVTAKLLKMNDKQRLLADKLINDVLFNGLFDELTTSSHIAE